MIAALPHLPQGLTIGQNNLGDDAKSVTKPAGILNTLVGAMVSV